jgi:hypothetical protein
MLEAGEENHALVLPLRCSFPTKGFETSRTVPGKMKLMVRLTLGSAVTMGLGSTGKLINHSELENLEQYHSREHLKAQNSLNTIP